MNEELSKCCSGLWLHDYKISRQYENGSEEICTRCKDRKFFRNDTPSHTYLSYHIKQCLQLEDKRFNREYNR